MAGSLLSQAAKEAGRIFRTISQHSPLKHSASRETLRAFALDGPVVEGTGVALSIMLSNIAAAGPLGMLAVGVVSFGAAGAARAQYLRWEGRHIRRLQQVENVIEDVQDHAR